MPTSYKCPVCDSEMKEVDIPRFKIFTCSECPEIGQLIDGSIAPIGQLLENNQLGDDRIKAAISKPRVRDIQSFIDVFENTTRFLQMDLASAAGGLRTILHMIENRLDSALSKFSGLDLASDDAAEGLRALRAARELVSTLPPATRGVAKGGNDAGETSTPE